MIVLAAVIGMVPASAVQAARLTFDITRYGARGDGITDDTIAVQKALTHCSTEGLSCQVPANRSFLISQPLFLWGDANLLGADGSGAIIFNVPSAPYLLNIGISGRNRPEAPFRGVISNILFRINGGNGGRIIYLWRTDGATIKWNSFVVDDFAYSATSSGNDNAWLVNGPVNCIRKNIRITGNRVYANAKDLGSEGIGLNSFEGAVIANNEIIGVGDDPVGIHFSKHVLISDNRLRSVDGRLFVSNSSDVEISRNNIERMRSLADNKFYAGIALIYVGVETMDESSYPAPQRMHIHDNALYYPPGAIDQGAAINLNGVRSTIVANNHVRNDSRTVAATALHLSPVIYPGTWVDPDRLESGNSSSVWDVDILGNISDGAFPLKFLMTGNCALFKGTVRVQDNFAADFSFYCDKTILSGNRHPGVQP